MEEGKNGYLVPIKDSRALADAISMIIDDPDKLRNFGEYSRQKAVREFDEKKIVVEVLSKLGILSSP